MLIFSLVFADVAVWIAVQHFSSLHYGKLFSRLVPRDGCGLSRLLRLSVCFNGCSICCCARKFRCQICCQLFRCVLVLAIVCMAELFSLSLKGSDISPKKAKLSCYSSSLFLQFAFVRPFLNTFPFYPLLVLGSLLTCHDVHAQNNLLQCEN